MKRLTLTLLLVVAALATAMAQDVKGNYKKADRYLGKGEIAEAKKYADAAVEMEKYADRGEAWLVKGKVYQAIALSEDESIKQLAPNARQVALESYEKVKELEDEGSSVVKELTETQGIDFATGQVRPSILEEFRNAYFNKGVKQYNDENYEAGMESFEISYEIMPTDTLAGLYAMTCAGLAENMEGVERNAKALVNMDYTDSKVYLTWMRAAYSKAAKATNNAPGEEISDEAKKLWNEVLDIAKEGKEKNPEDGQFVKFMIDAYIRLGDTDQAVASLIESVEADPEDKISYFSLGTMYDEMGEFEKSKAAFQKAVEIDPQYFDAYFNYFVLYNNKIREVAAELNDLINAKGNYTDPEKGKELEKEINTLRDEAIDILEKCHDIQPDNKTVVENLAFMYRAIGEEEKAVAIEEKL